MSRTGRRARTLLRACAVAVPAVVVLTGCVGPARTFPVYEAKAVVSVEEASSAVQTVHAGISQALDDRNTGAYLSVTMDDAEKDVTTADGHFASIQPPDTASMRLRNETTALLQRASDAVERARIAIRAGDVPTLEQLNGSLPSLLADLGAFVAHHR
jgi:outer membrane murein-binding lipoprotein Lpp